MSGLASSSSSSDNGQSHVSSTNVESAREEQEEEEGHEAATRALPTKDEDDDEEEAESNEHDHNHNDLDNHNGSTTDKKSSRRRRQRPAAKVAAGVVVATSSPPTTSNVPTYQHVQGPHPGAHEIYKSIATVAGNVLEWYDFAIFGYFSDVIGEVFFPPNQDGHAAIIEGFAVFGGAFLMRPVGGLLLGHIGDVYGRKKALELSVFLMAIPTFLMGCLPSFRQAGHWAIVGLAVTRLLQGLSVGGQMMSSLVYCCEQQPRSMWGFYGSHAFVAANVGTFVGSIVGVVMRQVMTRSALQRWGWRIPFWSGLLVGLSGLYLHYYCQDDTVAPRHSSSSSCSTNTPQERPEPGKRSQPPLAMAFEARNIPSLIAATLVPMLWSCGFYLCFVWMAIFMDKLVHPPVPEAFGVNAVTLVLTMVVFFPYAGSLSDKYGRLPTMTLGGVMMAVLSFPMILMIGMGNPWTAGVAQGVLGVSLALWAAPMGAWLVESFEPEARLTSVAIGYNVAQALLGGFSPAIATLLVDRIDTRAPGLYLTAIAILALVGLHGVAPRATTTKAPLEHDNNNTWKDLGKEEGTVAESRSEGGGGGGLFVGGSVESWMELPHATGEFS